MKRILAMGLAFMLIFGFSALAEGQLDVTGNGRVYIAADQACATLGVEMSGKDLGELQSQANVAISAICDALEAAGLDANNISTNYMNISPQYEQNSSIFRGAQEGVDMIAGYTINHSLNIRTDDIDSIGSYIDAAFAAGANRFDSISFSAKDDSEARKKALELAVADAREKAEIMAAASGRELGEILNISYGSSDDYSFYNAMAGRGMPSAVMMDAAPEMGTTMRAAQIRVGAQVQISYELK